MRTTWSPTRTKNGWFPRLSPSGQSVLYGFWETHLAHLDTGQERQLLMPGGERVHPLGWLTDTTFIVATESGPAAIYAVDAATLHPTNLHVPNFAGVNFGNADAGSWGIYLARADGAFKYCIKNGQPFHPEIAQYGCYVSGDHLVTADISTNYDILHFKGETLIRRLPTDNKFRVNSTGDIVTGYYGTVNCYPWNQGRVDATITPWRREEPGAIVRVDGDLWIWSATDNDEGRLLVLGRRVGETTPIVLWDMPSVQTDAIWDGRQFVVAGNSDTGALQVRWVSRDAPRTLLRPRVSAAPIPPLLPPLEIAITTWGPTTGVAPLTVQATASSNTASRIEWSLTESATDIVGVGSTFTTTLSVPGRYVLSASACRDTERVTTGRRREIIVDAAPVTPPTSPVSPPAPLPMPPTPPPTIPAIPPPPIAPVPLPTPTPPAPVPIPEIVIPTPTPPAPEPIPEVDIVMPARVSWWSRVVRVVRVWLRRYRKLIR